MNVLAIETSSIACSVALQTGETVLERHAEQAREHTKLLVPMIEELLAEAQLTIGDLDALVLGNGPGSFIGLRIAASLVQGMAFAAALPVVPVSSLLAVASEAFAHSDVDEIVVTADAHMNEVYMGRFRRDGGGCVVAVGAERLQAVAEITEVIARDGLSRLAAGAGWQRYPTLFELNQEGFVGQSDVRYPRARYLLAEAQRLLACDECIRAQDISPTYLRTQVATPKPSP